MSTMMKDSGIGWLGCIPDDWELYKGKYVFSLRTTKGNQCSKQLLSPTQKYGVIPQDLYEKLSGMNTVKLSESTDYSTLKTVHAGDYCISLRSFQGGFEYSNYEGVVSPAYQIFYPTREIDRRYYKYLFKDDRFITEMNSFTMSLRDGKPISFWDFGNSIIPYPSLTEQKRIADYLDKKCLSIDNAIAAGEQEIQKLKEYKQAVITQAVTMGLDPNTKSVHCDNKWFKTIPESWTVFRIKNVCDIVRGGSPRPIDYYLSDNSDDMNWIMIGDTVKGDKYVRSTKYKITAAGVLSSRIIQPDTLLLTNSMSFGEPYFSAIEGCIHDGWLAFSNYRGIVKEYLYYCLMSEISIVQFKNMANGTTVNNLNIDKVKSTYILVPNIEEQKQIVEFLDEKIAIINELIDKKSSQLDKLVKFKKVLIYTYVTGKKEVPNG